jgi:hypothetical protein
VDIGNSLPTHGRQVWVQKLAKKEAFSIYETFPKFKTLEKFFSLI